ncbi:MAG TPA: glycosyltransferase, partial [Isosphaeraceae bacterium]
ATAAIVAAIAGRDPRVRLIAGPALPEGWCGKQHACARLAAAARSPLLAFLDADVRLEPDGLARLAAFLDASGADLVSGVPHQSTGTLAETLVIPLIHFILLGFLPLRPMRSSTHPAFAAGCGQLFLTRRDAYGRAGGHAAIRASLHDGITLPRAYRRAGLRTDLCDATAVASCRMYRGLASLWHGLGKNAGEALAAPRMIVPATLLLAGGQILPFALLAAAPRLQREASLVAGLAAAAAYLPRLAGVARFRQSPLGAALHPLGVALLLAIQWSAFARGILGKPATWKRRPYPAQRRYTESRGELGAE